MLVVELKFIVNFELVEVIICGDVLKFCELGLLNVIVCVLSGVMLLDVVEVFFVLVLLVVVIVKVYVVLLVRLVMVIGLIVLVLVMLLGLEVMV